MALFKLPRLDGFTDITPGARPTTTFLIWWGKFADAIEVAINGIQSALDAAGIAQDAADTAIAAAATADAAAAAAQASTDSSAAATNLANSGTEGLTITATDVGASVTITISAHNRIYGDGTTVAVAGGNITGLAYSTKYYLYYNDPARTGGSVTFLSSTTASDAIQQGDVHSLGGVETPAAAAPPETGTPWRPPGVVDLR